MLFEQMQKNCGFGCLSILAKKHLNSATIIKYVKSLNDLKIIQLKQLERLKRELRVLTKGWMKQQTLD